jgi:hypothetical protein
MRKKQTVGLDDRCRDKDGEIRHKRRDTLVGTLRQTYGRDFAAGFRSDMKLSDVLARTGAETLGELVQHRNLIKSLPRSASTSALSATILSSTSAEFAQALKKLADK